ncbi:MAG: shikimate dehydrogenase substrate binding domain protein [Microvirga sp.]|jgi:shikimate dehydrogenase|nr:shikimate dehydrogenase substrate binding domain protein [Microvirga sp.]
MSPAPLPDLPGLPFPLTGATRVYAIVGDPIAQAGSPGLFNAAFRRRGIEAVLVPLHVAPTDLTDLVRMFRTTQNFDGLVVTVPHKIAISELIDDIAPMGRRIGAVNVIRKDGDRLVGDNFDGVGFVRGLSDKGHALTGRRVLIIGAGGAGRAVAHAVLDARPARIRLFDIDTARARAVAEELTRTNDSIGVDVGAPDPSGFGAVVNCTSIGMKPGDPFPVLIDRLEAQTLVVDIILKPAVTPLLAEAARLGCITHAGVHMLEGQVDAICDFFGLGPA